MSGAPQELGIPTANLDRSCLHGQLAQAVTGIYGGWAAIGYSPAVYPMVMSVGFNPFYGNKVPPLLPGQSTASTFRVCKAALQAWGFATASNSILLARDSRLAFLVECIWCLLSCRG